MTGKSVAHCQLNENESKENPYEDVGKVKVYDLEEFFPHAQFQEFVGKLKELRFISIEQTVETSARADSKDLQII